MGSPKHHTPSRDRLNALYHAAERLLEAREASMLTSDEWDDLECASAACREPEPESRAETFVVESDGSLIRLVAPRAGRPYRHRCTQASFEEIAHAIGEFGPASIVVEDLRSRCGLPWTQVAVAVAFLKERGIVVPDGNRGHAAASTDPYLDAMTEYQALRESPTD
jgi:hypothetical protein